MVKCFSSRNSSTYYLTDSYPIMPDLGIAFVELTREQKEHSAFAEKLLCRFDGFAWQETSPLRCGSREFLESFLGKK